MKNSTNVYAVIFVLLVLLLGCKNSNQINETQSPNSNTDPMPVNPRVPEVEFALDLTEDERQKNTQIINSLPKYQNIQTILNKWGFNNDEYDVSPGARDNPIKGELTGLIFSSETKQKLNGGEFKIVLMGPTKNHVENIRFQSFGAYSNTSRKQLLEWASILLDQIQMGKVPEAFKDKMLLGENVSGENPINNDFCDLSVLQKPLGNTTTDPKRISLDINFARKPNR